MGGVSEALQTPTVAEGGVGSGKGCGGQPDTDWEHFVVSVIFFIYLTCMGIWSACKSVHPHACLVPTGAR